MAIGPSNNLLSALSQLQGAARPAAAQSRPAQASTGNAGQTQNSFAAQLGGVNPIRAIASAEQRPAAATQASAQPQNLAQTQSRPIAARGGYLGQYVNILV